YIDSFEITDGNMVEPVINVDGFELSTPIPYNSYQWMLNGETINGATQSRYIVQENGDYQVIVSNERGCVDTSDIYPVNNASIEFNDLARLIQIWPNPTHDMVFVQA